ncbi:uncharacterized protein GJ701_014158 [Geothlypis trichas]
MAGVGVTGLYWDHPGSSSRVTEFYWDRGPPAPGLSDRPSRSTGGPLNPHSWAPGSPRTPIPGHGIHPAPPYPAPTPPEPPSRPSRLSQLPEPPFPSPRDPLDPNSCLSQPPAPPLLNTEDTRDPYSQLSRVFPPFAGNGEHRGPLELPFLNAGTLLAQPIPPLPTTASPFLSPGTPKSCSLLSQLSLSFPLWFPRAPPAHKFWCPPQFSCPCVPSPWRSRSPARGSPSWCAWGPWLGSPFSGISALPEPAPRVAPARGHQGAAAAAAASCHSHLLPVPPSGCTVSSQHVPGSSQHAPDRDQSHPLQSQSDCSYSQYDPGHSQYDPGHSLYDPSYFQCNSSHFQSLPV